MNILQTSYTVSQLGLNFYLFSNNSAAIFIKPKFKNNFGDSVHTSVM
jgi:hypothetical protein